ncbi:MAG: thiamine biosynthesis protein ThiF, partial [Sphingobacteriaceae bacterium]
MDQTLYSESLPNFVEEVVNIQLRTTLLHLKALFPNQQLLVRKWGTEHIAVSVFVEVALPQFHDPDEIDIESYEPILLVFNLKNYPYRAPSVYPDRLSFPRTKLGHLYIAVNGRPPQFCLVRGDMD